MSIAAILTLITCALVGSSALLTAALSAISQVSEPRIRTLREEGFAGAESLSLLRADESRRSPFATLRILLLLAAIWIGLAASVQGWGFQGVWLGGPAVILLVLIFGDLLPRGLGTRRPVHLALSSSPIIDRTSGFFGRVLYPFLWAQRRVARRPSDRQTSDHELEVRETLELGSHEGVLEADEHRLVERAFQLDELTAWDAMTPRVDVFAWPDSWTLAEIEAQLPTVPYSRVPVYGNSVDDVTGILYVREAYQALVMGRRAAQLSELSRDPFFVPGSLSLGRLLRDFQTSRIHMGIVADEFGGTDGLVTLEDVLEELVGEIVDETDVDTEVLIRVSRNEILADGGVDLREINYRFNVTLPVDENRSLNGFILEELGQVPEPGTRLSAPGVQIEILEATETQVVRARLRRIQTGEAEEVR